MQTTTADTPARRIPAIDVHIHLVRGNPFLKRFGEDAERISDAPVAVKAERLRREMDEAGVQTALGMGHIGGSGNDPLGVESTLQVAARVPGLKAIGAADPRKQGKEHFLAVERQIARNRDRIVALKAYLGYIPIGPEDARYTPYYRLAAKYDLPMVLHTGDIWSDTGLVKYAHPLRVDEVAVRNRSVRFVMAHIGNPWIADAGYLVGKNENVYTDLSGLVVADDAEFGRILDRKELPDAIPGASVADLKKALQFSGYDRILYGSDWPGTRMEPYRRFVELLIPPEHHEKVLRKNAEGLFLRRR